VVRSDEPAGLAEPSGRPHDARRRLWQVGAEVALLGELRRVVLTTLDAGCRATARHAARVKDGRRTWGAPRVVARPILRRERDGLAVGRTPLRSIERRVGALLAAARHPITPAIAVGLVAADGGAGRKPKARLPNVARFGAVGAGAALLARRWTSAASLIGQAPSPRARKVRHGWVAALPWRGEAVDRISRLWDHEGAVCRHAGGEGQK